MQLLNYDHFNQTKLISFKSTLSLVFQVNVVLNRTRLLLLTVTDVSATCAVVIFSVKVSCTTSVDGIKLWLLT